MTPPLLGSLARGIARRPLAVVGLGALVCALLGGLAVAKLQFKTMRVALVGDVPFVRQFLSLEEEFGDLNAIVVAIKAETKAETRAIADQLSGRLEGDPLFKGHFHRVAPDDLGGRALLFFQDEPLAALDQRLKGFVEQLPKGALPALLGSFASELETRMEEGQTEATAGDGELTDWVRRLLDETAEAAAGKPPEATALDVLPGWDTEGYAWAGDGETLIVIVDFVKTPGGLDPRAPSVNRLRELTAELATEHPSAEIGVTGKPALEVDEMRTYEADSLRATVAALIGVTLLLVLSFRRWTGPLLIGLCLALSVAATLGLASLWPGHLNLMAVVFVVVVIGLGVDFGIHLTSRYDEELGRGAPPEEALAVAFGRTGPAIVAGGLTTVGAFLAALFTDFLGLREFGAVAAFGVVASLAVMLTVLPGLLVLLDRRGKDRTRPKPPAAFRWLDAGIKKQPGLALVAILALTLLAAAAGGRLRYQDNLLLLQDQKLESVQLELELLRDRQTTGWFLAYTTQDLDELRRVSARAEGIEGVRKVESVLDVLPAEQEARLPAVRAIQSRLAIAGQPPPPATDDAVRAALERLQAALEEALDASVTSGREEALETLEDLLLRCETALKAVGTGSGLATYDKRLGQQIAARARGLAEPLAEPLTVETLPDSLRGRLVGEHGSLLLRIYPEADLWNPAATAVFLDAVRAEIPDVTGVPVLMYESSELMVTGYTQAGLYAFLVVAACVLVMTRSLRWTLLALVALAAGGLWTVGLMVLFGIELNPANLIALPLLLGVGIDTAVHVVHRLRQERDAGLAHSSLGRALLYSGLTSAAGFGSLMLSDHPGTGSIGSTITLGVLGCLFAGLIVPQAIVRVLRR